MAEASDEQKSRFIASYRLTPSRPFAGVKFQFDSSDGYQLSFHDDMVWVGFDASPEEWQAKLDVGRQALKTLLAILTIQVEYPFELEVIQWIEDKPRDETGNRQYFLGRLGPDFVVQKEAPPVTNDHLRKGEIHAHLASHSPYYRYALLDYSVALSLYLVLYGTITSPRWIGVRQTAASQVIEGRRKARVAAPLPNRARTVAWANQARILQGRASNS